MFVLCVLYSKGQRQNQDNQDKEVGRKYREEKKIAGDGEIFRTSPASLLCNVYGVKEAGAWR
jgi:hypothetical protein